MRRKVLLRAVTRTLVPSLLYIFYGFLPFDYAVTSKIELVRRGFLRFSGVSLDDFYNRGVKSFVICDALKVGHLLKSELLLIISTNI